MLYVVNSFSLQMINSTSGNIRYDQLLKEEAADTLKKSVFVSAIGHKDTAEVISAELGTTVPFNRMNVSLNMEDTLLVCQLVGGRLPEGSTTLPEGFKIKYFLIQMH